MNQVIRSIKNNPFQLGRTTCAGLKLRLVTSMSGKQDESKEQIQKGKTGDMMSNSFGEGYATRSDEEGFGGTCGGKDPGAKIQIDKEIHENHPAYDKTQGSEVKEKEKGRHQINANC